MHRQVRLVAAAVAGCVLTMSATAPALAQCEVAKLLPSDGGEAHRFGNSVSISGDTAVIGSVFDDENGYNAGAAYVFRRVGSGWVQQAKLLASNGAAFANFGNSAAISADTIVIGAPQFAAAYVFTKPAGGWVDMTETAILFASDGGDGYGFVVAVSGDTLLVGANGDDVMGENSGSVYVYQMPAGGWVNMSQTAKLTASDGGPNHALGLFVAIQGDAALAGAHDADGAADRTGAAYIFLKPPGGWVNMTETAKLTASDGSTGDDFGWPVAIGEGTALVGAPRYEDGAVVGAAYVFQEPPGGWMDMTETAKLTPTISGQDDSFGRRLAVAAETAIVAAQHDDDNGGSAGAAYLYRMPAGGWTNMTETAKLTASDGAVSDVFGCWVTLEDHTAVIGAKDDDNPNGNGAGSAYVFDLADCNANDVCDSRDIAHGTSPDLNANGIPDECETLAGGIPTTSQWGLIIMIATLLAAGAIVIRRRPSAGAEKES